MDKCKDVYVPNGCLAYSQRHSRVAFLCPGSDGSLLSLKGGYLERLWVQGHHDLIKQFELVAERQFWL